MKNYYEILEVDKNASEEVIEKAYKTLAKKYHQDLQNNSNCQDKMRQINEAYEILSNDFKRREYDEKIIKRQSVSIEEYNRIIQENNRLKKDLKRVANQREMSQNQERLEEMSIMQRYYEQIKKATKQPQMRYERKKTKISLEKIKKIVIYIAILIGIGLVLAIVPFTRKFFINLYNNNVIIKLLVDTIVETFSRGF